MTVLKFYIFLWSHCNTHAYVQFMFYVPLDFTVKKLNTCVSINKYHLPRVPFLFPCRFRIPCCRRHVCTTFYLRGSCSLSTVQQSLHSCNCKYLERDKMAKCSANKHVIVVHFFQFQSGFSYNFVLHKKGFTFSISRNISLSLSLSLSYHV